MTTTQVPVETTANGRLARQQMRQQRGVGIVDAADRPAFPASRPVRAAISGRSGPSRSPARRTGANSRRQPIASTSVEKSRARGFQRSVWQPSEVTSFAATPVRAVAPSIADRSGLRGARRTRPEKVCSCQKSCAPRLSPIGSARRSGLGKGRAHRVVGVAPCRPGRRIHSRAPAARDRRRHRAAPRSRHGW